MKSPIVLTAALLAGFVVGSTTSAQAQSAAEIRACIDGRRFLTMPENNLCANENWLTWNRQGPAGPAGPAGLPGPQGDPGSPVSLPPSVAARITARLAKAQALEARLAAAKPGSKAERQALLAALRLHRQAQADLVASLSP